MTLNFLNINVIGIKIVLVVATNIYQCCLTVNHIWPSSTQPNPTHSKYKILDPTRPNLTQPNPCPCLLRVAKTWVYSWLILLSVISSLSADYIRLGLSASDAHVAEMGQVEHRTSTSTSTDAIWYKFKYRYANMNLKKIWISETITKTKETNCAIKMHRDLCTLYLNHVTQNVSKLSLVTTNTCTVVSQVCWWSWGFPVSVGLLLFTSIRPIQVFSIDWKHLTSL